MQKLKVVSIKEVKSEEGNMMSLRYVLTRNCRNHIKGQKYYGIEIEKESNGTLEREKVEGISHSKEFVQGILECLYDNVVTPVSMVEVIDDLVTESMVERLFV